MNILTILCSVSFYLSFALADLPTCSVENKACEPHSDNVITTIAGISEVEECKQLCSDTIGCNIISHFGPDSSPFKNHCMLLRSCSKLDDCVDCRSKSKVCFESCNKKLAGIVEDNFLETIFDVGDESTCLLTCSATHECVYYTYYTSTDPHNPNLCILLKEILGPIETCEHCSTGMPGCRNSPDVCQFSSETTGTDGLTYHTFNASTSIRVQSALLADCEMNIVVVGGGGGTSASGGGGSGYVITSVEPVTADTYMINVGAGQESTSIEFIDGRTIMKAKAGHGTNSYMGGAGYSGGGGGSRNGNGNGGSDGGSGKGGSYGGTGSNLDIATIHMENFQLTPGEGGEHEGNSYYGGGGGGVLVNGEGPKDNIYSGKGFGGGQGYTDQPAQGIVLLEMKQKHTEQ